MTLNAHALQRGQRPCQPPIGGLAWPFCAPPYKTHTRCKSAPHRPAILSPSHTERKWRYADRHSTTQHDLPQRETGAQGPGPRAEEPQPHRPSGPQRGGQVHAHEAAGGGAGAHGRGHSGERAAASQKRADAERTTGLPAAGLRPFRRIDGAAVPRLHGRPQGPAPPQSRHRQSDRHGRPAGEVQERRYAPSPAANGSGWASPRRCWASRPS